MEYAEEDSSMKAKVLDCGATSSQKLLVDPGILDIVVQNDANKFPEDDELWLKSIINNGFNQGLDKTVRALKIQKVPRIFRGIEANKNCFDPLVVSIGPYHHGKTELEFMEKHKSKMANLYVENNMEKLEELYKRVVNVATAARECYTE